MAGEMNHIVNCEANTDDDTNAFAGAKLPLVVYDHREHVYYDQSNRQCSHQRNDEVPSSHE